MDRRAFVGWSLAAAGLVFAPKYGRWHRQGSGILTPPDGVELWLDGQLFDVQSFNATGNTFRIVDRRGTASVWWRGQVIPTGWYPDGKLYVGAGDAITVDWQGSRPPYWFS